MFSEYLFTHHGPGELTLVDILLKKKLTASSVGCSPRRYLYAA